MNNNPNKGLKLKMESLWCGDMTHVALPNNTCKISLGVVVKAYYSLGSFCAQYLVDYETPEKGEIKMNQRNDRKL